jgi:hypothetical protein
MKQAVIDPTKRESSPHLASWYTPGLSDGLGDRLLMFDNTSASSLELLRFRRDFSDRAEFEAAVRERLRELENFDHPAFAKVRALKWLGEGEGLALISNHTVGQRLSEVLQAARGPALGLDLIRQITPVLADLQQQGDGISHGVLTPERILVTPGGKLVVVEHVLGSALQALALPAHRLRSDLGLAVRGADAALDSRADVVQLGIAALSLVLGRRLDPSEYPLDIAGLLDELDLIDAPGARDFSRLQGWLQHALQLGGRAFASAVEAHDALRDVLEERDATPRQNVLEFPAPIEIITDDWAGLAPATPAIDAPPPVERDIRLTIELPSGSPLIRLIGAAFTAAASGAARALRYAGRAAKAVAARRVRPAARSVLDPAEPLLFRRPAPVPRRVTAARVLAVVCVVQSLVIAALVATRPPEAPGILAGPAPVEAPTITEAPKGTATPPRPRGRGAARGAGVSLGNQSAAPAAATAAAGPATTESSLGRSVLNGVKTVGSAVGQAARDVWHFTAELVDSVFNRMTENLRR